MNLLPLCAMEFQYTWLEHVDYGAGGQSVGWLDGSFSGERLSGSARLVNIPPRRPDNVFCPTIRGILTTGDDAKVFFEMNGLSLLRATDQARVFTTSLSLRTSDQRYAWANEVVAAVEGILDTTTNRALARAFTLENTFGQAGD